MHSKRSATAIFISMLVLAIVIGSLTFLSPTNAKPLQQAPSHFSAFSTVNSSQTIEGFTLSPTQGPANKEATASLTPPESKVLIFSQISAGRDFNLGLSVDGYVYAWGHNYDGQFGNGTVNADSMFPVRVKTPESVRITQISAGYQHGLAIGDDGNVYTWGKNSFGQLGDGTTSNQIEPVLVQKPKGVQFTQISAGDYHSLAIGNDKHAYAWGLDMGQLGIPNGNSEKVVPIPTRVDQTLLDSTPGSEYISVSAGSLHSFALGSDGHSYAWGSNSYGQLGVDSTSTKIILPERVRIPHGIYFTQISAGRLHSLALGSDGHAYAWGRNNAGQVGDGTADNKKVPTRVGETDNSRTTYISAGNNVSLAINDSGHAYAWGTPNWNLGDSAESKSSKLPLRIDEARLNSRQDRKYDRGISAGAWGNCIILDNAGHAYSWGNRIQDSNRSIPQEVSTYKYEIRSVKFDTQAVQDKSIDQSSGKWNMQVPLHKAAIVDVQAQYDVIIKSAQDYDISIKNDSITFRYEYKDGFTVHFDLGGAPGTPPPDQYVDAGGMQHIQLPDMPVWTKHWFNGWVQDNGKFWDFNKPVTDSFTLTAQWEPYKFKLTPEAGPTVGGNTVVITPPDSPKGIHYLQLAGGQRHSVALGSDGHIYTWGNNSFGQLGNGTQVDSKVPVRVKAPKGVLFTKISVGDSHNLALGNDGHTYAWGWNSFGQIGDGSTTHKNALVRVKVPEGVRFTQIHAASYHSIALGSDGKAYTWGQNSFGQLGDGKDHNSEPSTPKNPLPAPAKTPDDVQITNVSAGMTHSVATSSDGHIYHWGNWLCLTGVITDDDKSQCSKFPTSTPSRIVENLPAGVQVIQLKSGMRVDIALCDDGHTYAWGKNYNGEFANGTRNIHSITNPVRVGQPDGVHFATISDIAGGQVLALGDDGHTYAWGRNVEGQLGSSNKEYVVSPVRFKTPDGLHFTSIGTGNSHTLAFGSNGHAYALGSNSHRQIGNSDIGKQAKEIVEVNPLKISLNGMRFDKIAVATKPKRDDTEEVWKVTAPAHDSGKVQTTIQWTLGGAEQEDYELPYFYYFVLPDAGAIPFQKLYGGTLALLSVIAALTWASYGTIRNYRTKGRHKRNISTT
ncbi:RCC1 domain-containing protein [Bombiscardovia coagulans]|uniref:Regulator of chromosome condensation (RCC1) repeat n=1 Tax=Bombiscardovia coagulans TaxID=686666 RepID=A0A261ETB4_9BIFI|nr:hypothetical protein [Bombiscardovia coagulans]OZG50099.1 Regulator of chromosome condensation (RCC1) repeat [Bombiscardovia coagulans]